MGVKMAPIEGGAFLKQRLVSKRRVTSSSKSGDKKKQDRKEFQSINRAARPSESDDIFVIFRDRLMYRKHDDRTVHYGPERKNFGGGFKKRGRPFQKRGGYFDSRGRGRGARPLSRLDEEDVDMGGDRSQSTKPRHSPYGGYSGRRSNWSSGRSRGRGRANYNNSRLQRIGMAAADEIQSQSQPSKSDWYKVTIPHGRTIGQEFITTSISERLSTAFNPIKFHLEGKNSVFNIQGYQQSSELRRLSEQVIAPNGFKMIVLVRPTEAPSTPMSEDVTEKLKLCMSNRYDVATKCLNMDALHSDSDLNKEGIFLSLGKIQVINEVIGVIKANIPELQILKLNRNRLYALSTLKSLVDDTPNLVHLELGNNQLKSEMELNSISKLKLTTLTLDGNPLCDKFKDETSYISVIRKRFPKLEKLDGHVLPPPITFDLEAPTSLPPSKESQLGNDEQVKTIVLRFLKEYFGIYDGDDRQALMSAYHENAILSMSCNYNKLVTGNQPNFSDYMGESRNLLKVTDSYRRSKQLKSGRLNVVAHLTQLPSTQHDLDSFTVDVSHVSPAILTFSVSGVFKERSTKSGRPPFRFFTRMFVTAPQGSGIVIVNEQLFITNASTSQVKKAFATPPPPAAVGTSPAVTPLPGAVTPLMPTSPVVVAGPSNTTPVLQSPGGAGPDPAIRLQMIEQFSLQSQMNAGWSERCLVDNGWDYDKSAKVFMELKEKNGIPPEAFVK